MFLHHLSIRQGHGDGGVDDAQESHGCAMEHIEHGTLAAPYALVIEEPPASRLKVGNGAYFGREVVDVQPVAACLM